MNLLLYKLYTVWKLFRVYICHASHLIAIKNTYKSWLLYNFSVSYVLSILFFCFNYFVPILPLWHIFHSHTIPSNIIKLLVSQAVFMLFVIYGLPCRLLINNELLNIVISFYEFCNGIWLYDDTKIIVTMVLKKTKKKILFIKTTPRY